MTQDITQAHPQWLTFQNRVEHLKQRLQDGTEFWSARDLQTFYEYSSWQKFEPIITRAVESVQTAGLAPDDHFRPAMKGIGIGSGSKREVLDFHVSRLGCYHLAMVSDPSKEQAAFGRLYFTAQTRFAEAVQAAPPALPASPLTLARQMLEALESQETRVAAIEYRLDTAPITSEKVGSIYRLGKELGQVMGDYRRAWRLFNDRFSLASYRDLPNNRYEEGLRFLRLQISAYTGQPNLLEE